MMFQYQSATGHTSDTTGAEKHVIAPKIKIKTIKSALKMTQAVVFEGEFVSKKVVLKKTT